MYEARPKTKFPKNFPKLLTRDVPLSAVLHDAVRGGHNGTRAEQRQPPTKNGFRPDHADVLLRLQLLPVQAEIGLDGRLGRPQSDRRRAQLPPLPQVPAQVYPGVGEGRRVGDRPQRTGHDLQARPHVQLRHLLVLPVHGKDLRRRDRSRRHRTRLGGVGGQGESVRAHSLEVVHAAVRRGGRGAPGTHRVRRVRVHLFVLRDLFECPGPGLELREAAAVRERDVRVFSHRVREGPRGLERRVRGVLGQNGQGQSHPLQPPVPPAVSEKVPEDFVPMPFVQTIFPRLILFRL